MSEKTPCALVDTNVWLDLFLPGRTGRKAAARLIEHADDKGLALAYATHSALDVYHRVSVSNKEWIRSSTELTERWTPAIKRLAWDCVADMQTYATVVPTDSSDLWVASKYRDYHDDFEDDLILAACRRAQASYLVTNDRKLLLHADVCAKTPAQMLALLELGL